MLRFLRVGLLVSIAFAIAEGQSLVRVWQDVMIWPTNLEGPADPNPPFDQFNVAVNFPYIYPYTLRINFPHRREDQEWRAIYLENEYLKCTILPDVGGHVYTCVDKIANRDIFYANQSLKKNWVGLRGSWAAFGLELNFPIGHSWVSTSPVDFAYQSNADGSASAWVANVDRVTGMQWRVEFVLRPGRAVLEQRVTLENRSDVQHPYYWWSNAAVRLESPQDQFILPANLTSVHGSGEFDSWPRSTSGADLSVVANYKDGAGLFAVGSREEFLAAYHPSKRAGLVHVAKLSEVPGKKTWTWGPSTWPNQNLSDDNSTYIEIQAGVLPSQENHAFLLPQERKTFTEYWLPARDLSGITRATVDAVAYLGRTASDEIATELNVTRPLAGARIEIRSGGDVVFSELGDLSPEKAWSRRLPGVRAPASLRIVDADGNDALVHTEGVIDADGPDDVALGKRPAPGWLVNPVTAADYVERAIDNERQANWDWALLDFASARNLAPDSLDIRRHQGRVLARLGQFPEAAAALESPAAAGDAEARYYLALSTRNPEMMRALAGVPAWSPAAAMKSAEWMAAAGDAEGALAALRSGVGAESKLVRAGAIELALLRTLERWDEARERLAHWLAVDPTDSSLRYEQYRLDVEAPGFWRHLGADAERVLNVAEQLMRLGQFTAALEVLEYEYPPVPANEMEPGVPAVASHPLIWFYRAHCKARAGMPNAAELDRGAALSVQYVFPNRPGTAEVLQTDAARGGANARFLNGLLLLSMRRTDEAIAALDALRTDNPALPSLHRTLGRIWLDIKKDKAKALTILQEGLRYEPNNSDLQQAISRAR